MRRQKAVGGRRTSRKLKITRTVIVPRWQKNVKAAIRGLKRDALYILAAIGGVWVVWHAAIWLGEKFGGG